MSIDSKLRLDILAHHEREAVARDRLRQECEDAMAKGRMTSAEAQERMAKGSPVVAADQSNLTTIDVEPVAVNLQWTQSDPRELVALKTLPAAPATLRHHQWKVMTQIYQDGWSGATAELGRGVAVKPTFEDRSVDLKLYSAEADTSIVAAHEAAKVEALGTKDPVEITRRAAMLALMHRVDWNLYFSRTDTDRNGTNGLQFKGIIQQIEEGTNGTVGTVSPFDEAYGGNGHIIDMKGQEWTFDNIRSAHSGPVAFRLAANALFMSPLAMMGLSASLDGAVRLGAQGIRPMRWGQANDGLITGLTGQGSDLMFVPVNAMIPAYAQGKYTTSRPEDAPATVPTVLDATVTSDNAAFHGVTDTVTSKWDSSPEGIGSVYYVITQWVNGRESLGTRWPTGTSTQAVTASQQVNFQIQTDPAATRISVYRSKTDQSSTATTETWHIFDVATDSSGTTVFFDNNESRPDTEHAIAMVLDGPAFDVMAEVGNAERALTQLRRDFSRVNAGEINRSYNGVRRAHLGPTIGQLDMGKIYLSLGTPANYYSICAPMVADPYKCYVFKNLRPGVNPAGAPYSA